MDSGIEELKFKDDVVLMFEKEELAFGCGVSEGEEERC